MPIVATNLVSLAIWSYCIRFIDSIERAIGAEPSATDLGVNFAGGKPPVGRSGDVSGVLVKGTAGQDDCSSVMDGGSAGKSVAL